MLQHYNIPIRLDQVRWSHTRSSQVGSHLKKSESMKIDENRGEAMKIDEHQW